MDSGIMLIDSQTVGNRMKSCNMTQFLICLY